MHCYEHIDMKSILIGAMMKKKHLPEDSPLYKKKKAIGFIYFNYIKSYI